jgi:hypothetical protein
MPTPTATSFFVVICLLAAARPFFMRTHFSSATHDQLHASTTAFAGWSQAPLPAGLTPLALSPRETYFGQNFPGEIAAFTDGHTTWIVRWVTQATRKLHPAAHCLRAAGYNVSPDPILAASDGTHWSTTIARREQDSLRVHERIVDAAGFEFTDVSSWFWTSLAEKSPGPWWCITRFESENKPEIIK